MQGGIGNGARRGGARAAAAALALGGAVLLAASSPGGADGLAPYEQRGHAPKVTITKAPPKRTSSHNATFKFKSNKKGTKFKCKLDGGSYQKCSSPRKVHVGKGKHTFSVYGTKLGVPGPVASRKWTVTGKSAGARHHLPQNFVFANGPGSPLNGLVLSANGPADCALQYCLVNEATLGADGAVIGGGPYPDCDSTYHYHGFLFAQPDRPSGCGWGHVTPFGDDEPSEVRSVAIAITLETAALQLDKPKSARRQLAVGMQQLGAAVQNPALDAASGAALDEAAQLDARADTLLAKAESVRGKQRKKKMKKADRLLDQALALKRQVWDRLVYGV